MTKKVPNVTFKTRVREGGSGGSNPFIWQVVTSADIFDTARV
ncbi:peroxiredoxin, partial [Francisella tularensis subsp. holarctica]|nr:peroxiredoxin [Francisella tularensis subsp. holarctica]